MFNNLTIVTKNQNNKKLTQSPQSESSRRNSSREQYITTGGTRYSTPRNKNESKTKDSIFMSNLGGGHRRTRNSLEDAILNAVLEQSVKGTK